MPEKIAQENKENRKELVGSRAGEPPNDELEAQANKQPQAVR